MAAEIADDDDVAWFEGWAEDLLNVGEEALAVDRTINDARRVDTIAAFAARASNEKASAPFPLSLKRIPLRRLAAGDASLCRERPCLLPEIALYEF